MSENPFSTRYIRPGALEYQFDGPSSTQPLIERLRALNWRAAIIGPHGCGKSTLLATLLPVMRDAEREVLPVSLHDGERRLPQPLRQASRWHPDTLVVVDGYEQLSRWSRWRLRRSIQKYGAGLLVTAHKPTNLPILLNIEPTEARFQQIVHQLLGKRLPPINDQQLAELFANHRGNMREALFDLYDLYELKQR
ncbi:MAG: hypothetical protein KDA42_04730 [Planctomycetales bacterium]|nr:hypothetical protein [Planctomycetales bacterium]